MNETTVNIPLLRKAVEWAEAEAAKPYRQRRWMQSNWIKPAAALRSKNNECGTCYCVAGFVASLEHSEADLLNATEVVAPWDAIRSARHPAGIAQRALGITAEQANMLFDGENRAPKIRRIAESIAGERL